MIPTSAVRRENAALKHEIQTAVGAVLDSGEVILGEQVESFEGRWARGVNARFCVGLASGLDALEAGLRAVGVTAGDQVIVPALSAAATVLAPLRIGARPCFVDVDRDTALMSTDALMGTRELRPKAIVPVALYGLRPTKEFFTSLVDQFGCPIVVDMAQAHGSLNESGVPDVPGNVAAWSFYPTKNLGALGDAGCLTTDDPEISAHSRRWRNYGQVSRYQHVEEGANSRLDEIQAAILSAKLSMLSSWTQRRRLIADHYLGSLEAELLRPLVRPDDLQRHAVHQFVVRPGSRQNFQEFMAGRGVATDVHYPRALTEHAPFRGLEKLESVSNAVELTSQVVSVPVHPFLTDEEVDVIAKALSDWCSL